MFLAMVCTHARPWSRAAWDCRSSGHACPWQGCIQTWDRYLTSRPIETCKGLCKEGSKCLKLRQATGGACFPDTEDCDAAPDREVAGETIRGSRTGIGGRGALPGFWTSNLGSGLRLAAEPHSLVGSICSGILAEALRLSGPGVMHLVAVTYAPTEKRLHWLGFLMASGLGFALWCSAVPPGAVTHVTEHHPSRGQMWQGKRAQWVSGVPLCGAPDACAYQPRRVQSVGELVVCRPSRSLIPALGTPVGAQWCKGVKSGLARQGHPLPVLKHGPRSLSEAAGNAVRVVKAGTEQLVAGPAVPPPWPGLASATRPKAWHAAVASAADSPERCLVKANGPLSLRCYCVSPRLWGL